MSVVFFEGFNHNNSDAIKLDPNYWSSPDMNSISFSTGRTNEAVYLSNSNYADGTSANKRLDLSNFTSPLVSENAFGIGFWVKGYTLKPETRLLSISDGNTELMQINVIKTTYSSANDSFGLEIIQNAISKGIYDFRAVVGASYSLSNFGTVFFTTNDLYLEFYIDPKNTNTIRIRVNGMDMINTSSSTTTNINGFSSITKISLYGAHNSWTSDARGYDDFYLTNGDNIDNTLLGKEVKIYRLNPESNTSTSEWSFNRGWGPGLDLSSNDGDASYYFTDTNDKISLFNMNNLPASTGSVGGIKINNTARKVAADVSFTNVYAPADGQPINTIGGTYNLNSTSYQYFNSFLLKNPTNNNNWIIDDINNIQLGMKKLS